MHLTIDSRTPHNQSNRVTGELEGLHGSRLVASMVTLLRALCLLLVRLSDVKGIRAVSRAQAHHTARHTQAGWTLHAADPGEALWGKSYGNANFELTGLIAVNQQTGDSYITGSFSGTSIQIGSITLTATADTRHGLVFKSTTDGEVSSMGLR